MKKFRKIALVTLMLIVVSAFAAAFAACGDKIAGISVKSDNLPQLTFVQGNELDLSAGKLTVDNGGTTEEIALNAEGVTVSGYNKDTLGEQELTIEYKGQSTTLKVNVVARLVVENYDANYFVGEQFNSNKGRVKVTDDDGITTNVSLSDSSVSVTLDSSAAGQKTASITYSGTKTYTGTFPVEIFEIDEAKTKLQRPNKNTYKSHETEIDLAGGYLRLSNAAGTLTKDILLSESMISGFNPAEAVYANLANPLRQTVTVNYAGTRTFEISVTYSYVSLVKERAKDFAGYDWSTAKPAISQADGENAIEAMKGYFSDLNDIERELITAEEAATVARVATVYGFDEWKSEIEYFSDTFYFNEDDEVCFTAGTSLDRVREQYNELAKSDNTLKELSDLLYELGNSFGDVKLVGDNNNIGNYLISVYSTGTAFYNYVLTGLEYAFTLNTLFIGISDSEHKGDIDYIVANKKTQISSILSDIGRSDFYGAETGDATLYEAVSGWIGVDIFGLMTNYCYTYKDVAGINILKYLYLPEGISKLIDDTMEAVSYLSMMNSPILPIFDNSDFLYLFDSIVERNSTILDTLDEVSTWIYKNITFELQFSDTEVEEIDIDGLIFMLRTTGYEVIHSTFLGVDAYNDVWNLLFELKKQENNGGFKQETVEEMLHSFIDLSPSEQYGLLNALNPNYESSLLPMPTYALDFINTPLTVMTRAMASIFTGKNAIIPESTQSMFAYLLMGVEDYSRQFEASRSEIGNFASFVTCMAVAKGNYMALTEGMENEEGTFVPASEADKRDAAIFYEKVGYILDKYLKILEDYYYEDSEIDLGEYEVYFKTIAKNAITVMSYQAYIEDGTLRMYDAVIAAYERLEASVNELLNCGNAGIIDIYYNCRLDFYELAGAENEDADALEFTLERVVVFCRSYYVENLAQTLRMWEEYQSSEGIKDFMIASLDVMDLLLDDELAATAEANVINALKAFAQLNEKDQLLFATLDASSGSFYYAWLGALLQNIYGDEEGDTTVESEFANQAVFLQMAYNNYLNALDTAGEAAALKSLKSVYADAAKAYETLNADGDAEKIDNYLFEMYNYYCEKCAELVN